MKLRGWKFILFGLLLLLLAQSIGCTDAEPASSAATSSAPAGQTLTQPGTTQTGSSPIVSEAGREISVQAAYDLIQKNKDNPDFIIIDVRTADEFNSGHLAGAVLLDYYSPYFKTTLDTLERNKEYLVYCKTGIRGTAAVRIMIDLGFNRVHNLSGGIVQWIEAGHPTVQ
jgi:rhodanese-related sulfurtransferase